MKEILAALIEQEKLDKPRAKQALIDLAQGKFNNSQMAAFLTVYLMRPIAVEELEGFREAMLELCLSLDLSDFDPIDLCGTGGDGKNTFNISTLASFIVAGAGQPVAKHGNNGVSSVCGSSNLLQSLGYEFTNDPDKIKRDLKEAGICFLHAPLFHPAMKNVAPIRRELGVKTFFNMLGPLVNPAQPKKQLVGVFSLELARLYSYLFQKSQSSFCIVHSLDVYDEISLTSTFKTITPEGENLLKPEDLGFKKIKPEEIYGGDTIEEARKIFLDILQGGGTEAQKNAVLSNAGLALSVAKELSPEEGIGLARESLESGKALAALEKLIAKPAKSIAF